MIWFFGIGGMSYIREAVIAGICWLVMNQALDALVLINVDRYADGGLWNTDRTRL